MLSFLDPSLLVAAGASFIVGLMGYIIARMWIKPIVGYAIAKQRLAGDLARYLSLIDAGEPADAAAALRAARMQAMKLVSYYSSDIPYWYRLLLDSRRELPTEAAGLLTNIASVRDPQQRRARIAAARSALRLR